MLRANSLVVTGIAAKGKISNFGFGSTIVKLRGSVHSLSPCEFDFGTVQLVCNKEVARAVAYADSQKIPMRDRLTDWHSSHFAL
jgi:hypothetical protein